MKIEAKLEELGLTLPAAPTPMANYVTCRQVGNLLFFSGAGPFEEGKPVVFGKVGGGFCGICTEFYGPTRCDERRIRPVCGGVRRKGKACPHCRGCAAVALQHPH